MIIEPTPLHGVMIIRPEPLTDDRGAFARVFCADVLEANGLDPTIVQINVSVNARAGTVRGLHYQLSPHGEAKILRATRGEVYDVAVDLRPASPTRGQWFGARLGERDRTALYVPPGCANGYQALTDDAEVVYSVSAPYAPEHERGLRHDDPSLGIGWPLPVTSVSPKDASWPLLSEATST